MAVFSVNLSKVFQNLTQNKFKDAVASVGKAPMQYIRLVIKG